MFNSLVTELTRPLSGALKLAGWGAAVTIAAAMALSFFSLAAFVWAEERYGTVGASLLLGTFFFIVTGAILVAARVHYRRSRDGMPPGGTPPWWKDPAIIAAGVELARIVGVRRIIPVVALGAVIVGALEGSRDRKRRSEETR
jgi:hypothetical protein